MFKVLGIITMIVVIVVLGGCAATLISVGNSVNDGQEKADSYALVADQITMGMTEAEVVAIAGEPEKRTVNDSTYGDVTTHTVYLYYGILNENGAQLVFEDDSLRAINRG